ncbi:MAG: flagellar basal body rod protein FlgB [Chloroflexi bacterium]|nr:flagellar basal body rod protein FlgB [Chloroflexota bacterium]
MVNPIGDRGLGTIQSWLHGLSQRQEAISDNIANIDTPGYRRKEVPFEAELQRSLGASTGTRLAATDPRHISSGSTLSGSNSVQATQALESSRLDGNNVDIDQEMVSLAETQMRYQAAASALNTKLDILRNVIRGL